MRAVIRSPERWVQVTDARTTIGPSRCSHGRPHTIPWISKAGRHRSARVCAAAIRRAAQPKRRARASCGSREDAPAGRRRGGLIWRSG